ncbi:MAG: Nif3-like dinuclear metal center hexameric protein [Winogradskyella sp.]|nr:Nif3-like dinuclear metal center hexameric protein [Winogradskyella sp.]
MQVKDIMGYLQELAPLSYAEDFDNVGLLVGDKERSVSGILVTLDTLDEVVNEAIDNSCNVIVSFHPIIFKGLISLTGSTYVERAVIKAIKYNIAIIAIHTALDNAFNGVNAIICEKLGLTNRQILIPQPKTIKKLVTYVPKKDAEKLKMALFKAGAGNIGNYDHCSFSTDGLGTYRGNDYSNPMVGNKGELQTEAETAISVTFGKHQETAVLNALKQNHPYEEIAYEVTTLDNNNQHIGMGMVGELPKSITPTNFLKSVKQTMGVPCIKHSSFGDTKTITKVAVLGGSGSFAIQAAKRSGADIFITSDLKYHDYFQAENEIILADIGHYESEQFTKTFLVDYLSKKITNFAIILSKTNTNPVKYL